VAATESRWIRTILGGVTTKYYYDGQRVILETDNAGTEQRGFVYGNYIDEVLALVIPAQVHDTPWRAGIQTYYYGHDHLFSVCILFGYDQGEEEWTVADRYEYDAYGSVHILSSDFCILCGLAIHAAADRA